MGEPLPLFPLLLPTVPLSERQKLPAQCGVYFALSRLGTVLYIGGTVNLYRRWRYGHHRLQALETRGCDAIAYYLCDYETLDTLEQSMIHWLMPPLNAPWRSNRREPATLLYPSTSARLSEKGLGYLAKLSDKLGISKTAVLTLAIRALAQREKLL